MEFSVEYFLFIPLVLAILFDPMSAALGAATGELVFSEIMLGQFGGLGELEKFITVTIGVYIAGRTCEKSEKPDNGRNCIDDGCDFTAAFGNDCGYLKVQFAVTDFEGGTGTPGKCICDRRFCMLK